MTANLTHLRHEHQELAPRIEWLKDVADQLDLASVEAIVIELEEALIFLNHHLLPHAKAEEDVLYRAYDQVANSPWATDTMRRDHREIENLTQELTALRLRVYMDPLTDEQKQEFRRVMFGLYHLLRVHFRNEEELLIPRLENALTHEAADQLVASMERDERIQKAKVAP